MSVGIKFADAGNGKQAIEILQKLEANKCTDCEGILLILMDHDMPIMNGVEVKFSNDLIYLGNIKDQITCCSRGA